MIDVIILEDWYDEKYYGNSLKANPVNTNASFLRVLRGGYWGGGLPSARSASRDYAKADDRYGSIGFRIVLSSP